MRGVRNFLRLSGLRSASAILSLLLLMAMVFIGGCAGLVSAGSSGKGTSGSLSISNVGSSGASMTSVTVSWVTNAPASSQVEYGTTSSYGTTTVLDATMVTTHQVTISGLKAGTLYHFRVQSSDTTGSCVSGDQTFDTAADTTPPTVSITSPSAGATLSGDVTFIASATDIVGVATVQFKVDNTNVGPALTSTPYSYLLNTTTIANGNHSITAVAVDTSGNSAASAAIQVTVANNNQVPSIASVSPVTGTVGTAVVISGTNFGATQGTSTVKFNGTAAIPTSWSATSIAVPVPSGCYNRQRSCDGGRSSQQRDQLHGDLDRASDQQPEPGNGHGGDGGQ